MCGKANCVVFIAVCILFRAYGLFVRYRARAYDNMYLIYKYLVQGNLRCLFLHACESGVRNIFGKTHVHPFWKHACRLREIAVELVFKTPLPIRF